MQWLELSLWRGGFPAGPSFGAWWFVGAMGLRCLCVGCTVSSIHLAWRSETSSGGIHVNNHSLILISCDFGIAALELGGSGRIFRYALAGGLAVGGTARAMS